MGACVSSAQQHREHMERCAASQRRGQWTRINRKIEEINMRARLRGSMTDTEQTDLDNCARELATVENMMDKAGQEP